ncbi:recombination regulator RecX [Streptomyces sp. NBC_00878]|uniref:recombination regulator RecX n=1 Tax=Streptomyces sp. NBC_00878 TaxID=2975854 RepID=UPI00225A70E8|nr:recombination regulator RecX [Streptomyces sp. NBC_00878]MCX4904956.1 recombination regulator RecX [Streptomyces sp. NBC_00878]
MTRRTDWAEYAHPVASEGKRRGGDSGSAGDSDRADTAHTAHDDGGAYGLGAWDAEGTYGDLEGDGRPDGGPRRDDGSYRGDGLREGLRDGDASSSGGSRRGVGRRGGGRGGDGGWPYGDDGPQDTGERGDRAPRGGGRGARGRGRRRGFGESSTDGDPQDGGPSSSSRAEKGEPPGDPAERARGICLRLLTGTPRTRKQLADALRKREIPDDVADEVLSRFEEVGLINDSAFADAWVESRHHGRGLARRALARELRTKGVDSALIDEAVGQLDSEQEEATARELVARKLRSTSGLDRDKRIRRLAGMLARKGYGEGMALRVVRQALEEEGEDTEFLDDGEGF